MKSKTAANILLILFSAILLFHFAILLKIIPYEFTWGGRLKSDEEMYAFETLSVLINLLLMAIVGMKVGYVKQIVSPKVVNVALWIFFGLFCLNTVGNVMAETTFEKYFTVVTLSTSWLLWVLLRRSPKP